MHKKLLSLSTLILVIGTQPAFADSPVKLKLEELLSSTVSVWKNQEGSTASFSFKQSSSNPNVWDISGSYVNNAAGYHCQGTAYPISGSLYAPNLTATFDVVWSNAHEDCKSVTGWTGYFLAGTTGYSLSTKWNLAYQNSSGDYQIVSGEDEFTYQPSIISSGLKAE